MPHNIVPDRLVPSQGLIPYNITLNLTSILNLPSRLFKFARIRNKVEDASVLASAAWATHPHQPTPPPQPGKAVVGLPGPLGFFTSGYMFALIAMAVLLHRIPNVVVPPRMNPSSNQAHTHERRFFKRIYHSIIPLDITSTSTRLALFLPTLYYISRVLLLLTVVLLQTSDLYPTYESGIVHQVGRWAELKEMGDINWSIFLAICCAMCVEAFVRGLDGSGFGFAINLRPNTSPFNLVGYGFLLHIYAHPMTHVNKPSGLPSRPDKHAIVNMTIPLLQLTLFHVLQIRKRWSNHRLLPTALTSFCSLVHFHSTILAHSDFFSQSRLASIIPTDPNSGNQKPVYSSFESQTGTATYPLLNYIPNVLETFLLLSILLTVSLNSLTQLLLAGAIKRPLYGLGLTNADGRGTGAWSWSPPWDEDFGILLVRVGIHSLEATNLRGWGNEVGTIVAPTPSPASETKEIEFGRVEMGRTGVVQVYPGSITTSPGSSSTTAVPPTWRTSLSNRLGFRTRKKKAAGKKKLLTGWNNEIKDVDVGASDEMNPVGGRRYLGIPGILSLDLKWLKLMGQFVIALYRSLWGLVVVGWRVMLGKKIPQLSSMVENPVEDNVSQEMDWESDDRLYSRFLHGEQVSDDEADEWDPVNEDESSESDDTDAEDGEQDEEAVGLYSDLSARHGGLSSATMMLAHFTNTGNAPLTRKRYLSLLSGPSPSSDTIQAARAAVRRTPTLEDETHRNCVICTVEPRQIICWPCRCLTMCDTCRENLATQIQSSKHRCPCCRRSVEGYSRIFIP